MSDQKKALFNSLPGNIILNSLYIPRMGTHHIIMGQSETKQKALHDIHNHLTHALGAEFADPNSFSPISSPDRLHHLLEWQNIPLREERYWNSDDPGMFRGGVGSKLPIRSQKGVQAHLFTSGSAGSPLEPHTPVTVQVFNDDYATGSIPWTIRAHSPYMHDLEAIHNHFKNYFESLGNQKTSWKKRYEAR